MLGVDYWAAPRVTIDARRSTPFEVDLGWTVNLKRKTPFIGRKALEAELARGSAWQMVGIEGDWDEIEALYTSYDLPPGLPPSADRSSYPLYADGEFIGYISSSAWSPLTKRFVGLATVKTPFSQVGTELKLEHTALYERRLISARVVDKPFFDPPRKKGDA
jgi:aminomethyltransferase